MPLMECPACRFDHWDGISPHDYGGRISAGLKCYGPRIRGRVLVDKVIPVVQAFGEQWSGTVTIPAGTLKPGSSLSVAAHWTVSTDATGSLALTGTPAEPAGASRKERLARALDSIESDLKLKRGSELGQPDPADRRGKRTAKAKYVRRKFRKGTRKNGK